MKKNTWLYRGSSEPPPPPPPPPNDSAFPFPSEEEIQPAGKQKDNTPDEDSDDE